jgi:hypothetical protein
MTSLTRPLPSRGIALLALFALALGLFLSVAYLARPQGARADARTPMPTSRDQESRTGVRIISAHVVGDGGIVDIRYQVIDPERADVREGDPAFTPQLDDESGGSLVKTAAMRKGHERRQAGTYSLLYYNREGVVHPGDFIDVSFGGVTLTGVPVT